MLTEAHIICKLDYEKTCWQLCKTCFKESVLCHMKLWKVLHEQDNLWVGRTVQMLVFILGLH